MQPWPITTACIQVQMGNLSRAGINVRGLMSYSRGGRRIHWSCIRVHWFSLAIIRFILQSRSRKRLAIMKITNWLQVLMFAQRHESRHIRHIVNNWWHVVIAETTIVCWFDTISFASFWWRTATCLTAFTALNAKCVAVNGVGTQSCHLASGDLLNDDENWQFKHGDVPLLRHITFTRSCLPRECCDHTRFGTTKEIN